MKTSERKLIMIRLEGIKQEIKDEGINSYVDSYLEIYSQLEDLEIERNSGSLDEDEYYEILDLCDYLAEKISQYYIENYYFPSTL